jgi:hypothetical protein
MYPESPVSSVEQAGGRVWLIALHLDELRRNFQLHAMAHDGALAGIVELDLPGEDAKTYFTTVTSNLEALDGEIHRLRRVLEPIHAYFLRRYPPEAPRASKRSAKNHRPRRKAA